MPILILQHAFTPDAQATRRWRDVRVYRCAICNKSVRLPMRTKEPIENLLADALRHDKGCPGPKADPPEPAPETEAIGIIRMLLKSAHPHPVEHPTMTEAWRKAADFLERQEQGGSLGPEVLLLDGPVDSFAYLGADYIEIRGMHYHWEWVESHGKMAYCAIGLTMPKER